MNRCQFSWLCLFLALWGCGFEPPLAKRGTRAYTLATDIPSAEALEGSYIVTFRSGGAVTTRRFANYFTEYQTRFAALSERYLGDPRVKHIQFLTTINLAQPAGADQLAELDPPRALQLAWSHGAAASLDADIARVDFTTQPDAASLLAEWDGQGAFWFAEPNYISRLTQSDNLFQNLSDQYEALNHWWLDAIHLPEASRNRGATDRRHADRRADPL